MLVSKFKTKKYCPIVCRRFCFDAQDDIMHQNKVNTKFSEPFIKIEKRNTYSLVLVDDFTKFVFLKPVELTIVHHVIDVWEKFVPSRIVSDRGWCFTSITMETFCKDLALNIF